MTVSYGIILIMRNISDRICRESQNKHFIAVALFPENRGLHDIIRKHGRTRQNINNNKILHMRITCRITKAKNTHSEHVILVHRNNGYAKTPL
jgi:hypothetical protein